MTNPYQPPETSKFPVAKIIALLAFISMLAVFWLIILYRLPSNLLSWSGAGIFLIVGIFASAASRPRK